MKAIKISLLSLVIFYGCRVAFVPKSSAEAIATVTQIQTDLSSLYEGYLYADDKTFDSAKYETPKAEIDKLVALEAARDHSRHLLRQAVLIQTYFSKYMNAHRDKGKLNDHELRIYQAYMKSLVKPILVSELSLK